ncbi:MAG: hypothetical protein ABIK07_08675 [Planctomycetota bacterium]
MVVETFKKICLVIVCLALLLPMSGCSKELIDDNPDVPLMDEAAAADMLKPQEGK